MRRMAVGSLMVLGLVAGSASTAFAGETTGNGSPVPRHGQPASICSYSGQDVPDDVENNPIPELDDDGNTNPGKHETPVPSGVRVQNYGQIVVAGGKPYAPSPGEACRGGAEE